ncbi:hypothetical protein N9934_01165 [Desulfosarcina sp.]|nr:hypothetical protein [Desulfosarcina sp.]
MKKVVIFSIIILVIVLVFGYISMFTDIIFLHFPDNVVLVEEEHCLDQEGAIMVDFEEGCPESYLKNIRYRVSDGKVCCVEDLNPERQCSNQEGALIIDYVNDCPDGYVYGLGYGVPDDKKCCLPNN